MNIIKALLVKRLRIITYIYIYLALLFISSSGVFRHFCFKTTFSPRIISKLHATFFFLSFLCLFSPPFFFLHIYCRREEKAILLSVWPNECAPSSFLRGGFRPPIKKSRFFKNLFFFFSFLYFYYCRLRTRKKTGSTEGDNNSLFIWTSTPPLPPPPLPPERRGEKWRGGGWVREKIKLRRTLQGALHSSSLSSCLSALSGTTTMDSPRAEQ